MNVDGKPINYDAENLIPAYMRYGVKMYIEQRIQGGSFLHAVLCNDLMRAASAADDINRHKLFDYILWLHNYAPPACYGDREKVRAWLDGGREVEER